MGLFVWAYVSLLRPMCVCPSLPALHPLRFPGNYLLQQSPIIAASWGGWGGGGGLKWAPPLSLPYGLFCWGFSRAVARKIRNAAIMRECNSHVEKHQADWANKNLPPIVWGSELIGGTYQEPLVGAESVILVWVHYLCPPKLQLLSIQPSLLVETPFTSSAGSKTFPVWHTESHECAVQIYK